MRIVIGLFFCCLFTIVIGFSLHLPLNEQERSPFKSLDNYLRSVPHIPIEDKSVHFKDWRDDLSTFIEKVIACPTKKIPGLSIAIVKDDQIIYSQGFGKRSIEKNLNVDTKTLFGIGSTTKAFTSAALAIAVDENKIDLDKPVDQYLSSFRLYDKSASSRVTPRDLLTHRTGVERYDFLWISYPNITRDETVRRIRYLQPSFDLRYYWSYNNLMFVTAGHLIDEVYGIPWEQFIKQRFFVPLKMNSSTTDVYEAIKTENYAQPYSYYNGSNVPLPIDVNKIVNIASPAGSIISNVEDMANWMRLHLNFGKFEDHQLISQKNINDTHSPQQTITEGFPFGSNSVNLFSYTYGLGWFIGGYRDTPMVFHWGNVFGHSASVSLFPKEKIGIVILDNADGLLITETLITLYAYDLILGLPTWITPNLVCDAPRLTHKNKEEEKTLHNSNIKDIKDYLGKYSHPAFGDVFIYNNGSSLYGSWNAFTFTLYNQNGDFFSVQVYPIWAGISDQTVQFLRNIQTSVDTLILTQFTTPIQFTNENYFPRGCDAYPQWGDL